MRGAPDVVVLGAGIAGAACAAALARERLKVMVVESGVTGGGATAAGMGHIVAMDGNEPEFALTRLSRDLWDEAAPELPAEVEFERRGTLWVAADEEEMQAARRKHAWYSARGVAARILDAQALAGAEPNLRPGLAGGLLVPGDAVVYPPCAAAWFLRRAEAEGAVLRAGEAVAIGDREVHLAGGERIGAGWVVCATGASAVRLFPELPIRPRKGHLAITARHPDLLSHQTIELGYLKSAHGDSSESVAFNVQPRATGQVLIGSSRQYGATHGAIDAPVLRRMLRRALAYMPALAARRVIRAWTGFRAATPDKLPLIGPHPRDARIWLATGHEGLGITTATGTAHLVACGIAGRAPRIAAEPYLPARFPELRRA
jgi:glycine/D-amino acid oxidase-like deaminating enzyme